MKKQCTALLLCLCLLLGCLPLGAAAQQEETLSGTSGSIHWQLEAGTLTVSGTGGVERMSVTLSDVIGQVEQLVIEPGVTYIGYGCFEKFPNLKSASLPDGLTGISGTAFQECRALEQINLPESITQISDSAFWGCSGLLRLDIPSQVEDLGNWFFWGCSGLQAVTLPQGLTTIGDHTFYGCTSLEEVVLPQGVTSIGNHAFWFCESLRELTLPEGVTSVGERAFSGCESLVEMVLPQGITEIPVQMFWMCPSLESVTIPEGVTSIGKDAFAGCDSLRSINLPESLRELGPTAFCGCHSLESLTVPEGVAEIGERTFEECDVLSALTLPESLTSIGANAFNRCPALVELRVPAGVTEIAPSALQNSAVKKLAYGGTRDGMIAAGVDPKDFPNVRFLMEGDPVYTITFDPNGGTVAGSPAKEVRLHENYGVLPGAVHPGNRGFLGWYTQPEGGERVHAKDPAEIAGDMTVYAHWFEKEGSVLVPVEEDADPEKLEGNPNAGYQTYNGWYNWDEPCSSYLYENGKGGLTRVQCRRENWWDDEVNDILIEEYDGELNLLASAHLQPELSKWGGFYEGQLYYFLVFGQENQAETDGAEVIRIVRYDKNWNRMDHAVLRSGDPDVTVPLNGGCPHMVESNGYLFLHTSREMYNGHQSNMSYVIDETTMEVADSGTPGYVSHSFNQFLLIDQQGRPVTLDQGDAYPRCLRVTRYDGEEGAEGKLTAVESFDFQEFPGETGANYTGASVGGFVETETGYLAVYDYDGKGIESNGDHARDMKRDVYSCYIDKETFTGEPVRLTTGKNASTPILVPTGLDGGFILWNVRDNGNEITDTLCWARYTADGQIGEIKETTGRLSDCAPVYHDGKYTWFTTDNDETVLLTFYSLDLEGNITQKVFKAPAKFADVSDTSWYLKAVQYVAKKGIMAGTGDGTYFEPNTQTTRAMLVQMLYQMEGKPSVGAPAFPDVPAGKWFSNAVVWAAQTGVAGGYANGRFGPNDRVTREQLAVMLYGYVGFKEGDQSGTADLSAFPDGDKVSKWARTAMEWAVDKGLIGGKNVNGVTKLDPQGKASRAEVAQVFMSLCKKVL